MRHKKAVRVADELGLTQPAISHALTRLRDIFDDPLFERAPHGLLPTPKALALEPKVAQIVDETNALLQAGERPLAEWDGEFKIAALDLEMTLFLPEIIDVLAAQAPKVNLVYRSLSGQSALDALRAGEVSLALGYYPNLEAPLISEKLLETNYLVTARKGHPYFREPNVMKAFLEADHLLVSPAGDRYGLVDQILEERKLTRRVKAALPNFSLAIHALQETNCIAVLPAAVVCRAAHQHDIEVASTPFPMRDLQISALRHQRDQNHSLLNLVVETCRKTALEKIPSPANLNRTQ